MSYFFSAVNIKRGGEIEIAGDEAYHLMAARRVRVGEKIKIQGPDRRRFLARVTTLGRKNVILVAEDEIKVPREPRIHIHLFQAATKEKTVATILQKSTELGVEAVHFFESSRSPYSLADSAGEKLERWECIVLESAKQCDRAFWPTIEIMGTKEDLERRTRKMDHFYVIDPRGKKSLSHVASSIPKLLGLSIGVCIGPEGGLSENELDFFGKETNAAMAHLGPRVLRASTAAPVAVAIIQSIMGDMQ